MSIITGIFWYLIYQDKKNKNQPFLQKPINQKEISQIEKKEYPDDLTGRVFLTLKEKEENRTKNVYGVFIFDFDSNYFGESFFDERQPVLGGEIDLKKERMLISMSFPEQIYAADQNREVTKITSSQDKFKKEAVWSNDGEKIAFMSSSQEALFDINAWDIVVSDLEGNEEKIAKGAHPFFSLDGKKILFLKENGINLIDIETKEEKLILGFNASTTFQLDLSLDKDRLVVSDPENKNIKVFKINSWENLSLEEIAKIETPNVAVSWPKFSPYDNKYLIYEEAIDSEKTELVAYDLENSKRYTVLNLSAYEHSYMWINDWR